MTDNCKRAKKVSITLKTISAAGGLPDIIELVTDGYLQPVDSNGSKGYMITYDDTEATGYAGTKTMVSCFGDNVARMERIGSPDSGIMADLMIERGKKHHCFYGTEFGDMMIGIYTHKIINRMTNDGGELYFKYTLDVNSTLLAENEVYMDVKPLKSSGEITETASQSDSQ